MKNLNKVLGIALLFSGVFAITNASAQTTPVQAAPAKATSALSKVIDPVVGKDSKGRTLYENKNGKGNPYYVNTKGVRVYEPKSEIGAANKKSSSISK